MWNFSLQPKVPCGEGWLRGRRKEMECGEAGDVLTEEVVRDCMGDLERR